MNEPTSEPLETDDDDFAARLRAARAFANLSQTELAEALDVSTATLKRMERGARPISTDERHAVADRCRVPRAFMDEGFEVVERRRADLADRLEAIERRLDALADGDGS